MLKPVSFSLCIMVCTAHVVLAESMSYSPVNPNFGGNPLNYNQLIGLANSQFTAPQSERVVLSDLEIFRDQVERRTLSAIASAITLNLSDLNLDLNPESGSLPPNFEFGDFAVSFELNERNEIVMNVEQGTDEIQIVLPNF